MDCTDTEEIFLIILLALGQKLNLKKKEHYNRLFKFFHLPFSIMRTVKQNSNDLNQERQIIGEKQKIQIVTCQTFYLELSDLLKFTSHKKFAASFTT